MIDDKRIKSAAQGYCDATYGTLNEHPLIAEAFKQGVNWAIQQFLKDLWHSVSEEPKDNKVLFVQYHQLGRKDPWYITLNLGKITNWRDTVADFLIQRWCYIDDLLPKEGGKQ